MEVKPGYKQTELGVIPEDWEIVVLDNVSSKIQDGTHFSPKVGGNDYFYITSKNIGFGKLNLNHVERIDAIQHKNIYRRCDVKKGDILLTKDGINTGNAAINDIDEEFSLLSSVAFIRLQERKFNNKFFMYQLLSDGGQGRIHNLLAGNAITRLTLDKIKKLLFIVPPSKSEQDKVAEPLIYIDSLITSLEKLIAKKKLIKQGVMQELLTGKRRLPGFNGVWKEKTYGEVFQFLSTATYSRDSLIDSGDIKYVHYGDVHTKFDDCVDIGNADLPSILPAKLKSYALLETGDVIIVDASEDYSGIGKSVEVINNSNVRAIAGLHTFLLRDTAHVFVDGYRAFIHSIGSVKKQFDFLATGMKVYGVSKNNLKKVTVPVPPKDEQKAIVAVIRSMTNEISKFEIQLSKYRLLKQGMMQELLTGRIRLL